MNVVAAGNQIENYAVHDSLIVLKIVARYVLRIVLLILQYPYEKKKNSQISLFFIKKKKKHTNQERKLMVDLQ